MKNNSVYNNFLVTGILYSSIDEIYTHCNDKDSLLPMYEVKSDKNEPFKNFTHKKYSLKGISVVGYTHSNYFKSFNGHNSNKYEVYIYTPLDKEVSITKINAQLGYKKNLFGKINFDKPSVKIESIKVTSIKETEDVDSYNKLVDEMKEINEISIREKNQLDYTLKHNGEE